MNAPWQAWPARWEAALRACDALGGDARKPVIEPPASLDEVEWVEAELERRLPESFRPVLLRFPKRVEFR